MYNILLKITQYVKKGLLSMKRLKLLLQGLQSVELFASWHKFGISTNTALK